VEIAKSMVKPVITGFKPGFEGLLRTLGLLISSIGAPAKNSGDKRLFQRYSRATVLYAA